VCTNHDSSINRAVQSSLTIEICDVVVCISTILEFNPVILCPPDNYRLRPCRLHLRKTTRQGLPDSGDFDEWENLLARMQAPPPDLDELYLLGTKESFIRLEEIIASTDKLAQPFIEAMTSGSTSLHSLDRLLLTQLPDLT
jgi:hypothetical protein